MATVAHRIYSRYDPKHRAVLERATGQISQEELEEKERDSWRAESSSTYTSGHRAPPPYFVPASTSSNFQSSTTPPQLDLKTEASTQLSSWYKSLTSEAGPSHEAPHSPSTTAVLNKEPLHTVEPRTKNNWFIMNALPDAPPIPALAAPSLAEILDRDPPTKNAPHRPPVWLAIGPSNKGFAMLQNKGWNEGEALGSNVIRRRADDADVFLSNKRPKTDRVVREERQVEWDKEGDLVEVQKVDVIDLTLSESDSDEEQFSFAERPVASAEQPASTLATTRLGDQTALITPIPIVLKSDRLGLGLKAKTTGPYRSSLKRVTHGEAALKAHIRAAEDTRKLKKRLGRGRRGFAKQDQQEATRRKELLAYMND